MDCVYYERNTKEKGGATTQLRICNSTKSKIVSSIESVILENDKKKETVCRNWADKSNTIVKDKNVIKYAGALKLGIEWLLLQHFGIAVRRLV